MSFPVIIKDGNAKITFTSNEEGTYQGGEKCLSSLDDYMFRVEAGSAEIISEGQSPEAVSLVKELISAFTFSDGIAFGKKWAFEVYQDIAFRLFNAGHKVECESLYYAWEETSDNGDDFVSRLNRIIN